jgi:hypothetical protein
MERKDIEERYRERPRKSEFGGRTNWDTYEASLILSSDENLYKSMESWSDNFNKKIRNGTFDENKAKDAIKKYLLKDAKKQDEDIDMENVNMDEILDEIILMKEPLPPRKKDYAPGWENPHLRIECENKGMEFVPGFYKEDGTWVTSYCRHTKFTDYARKSTRDFNKKYGYKR